MAYIASQGPQPNTVDDFWRMLWQYEIRVVIMACNEFEGAKVIKASFEKVTYNFHRKLSGIQIWFQLIIAKTRPLPLSGISR